MKSQETPSIDELFAAVIKLQQLLNRTNPNARTIAYVNEYLPILKKNKDINDFIFLGKLHYFAMTLPNYAEDDDIDFTADEMDCWEIINSVFNDQSDPYSLPLLEVSVLKLLGLI